MNPDAQQTHPFFIWVGAIIWWPLTWVRPEFRSALWVLYCGVCALLVMLIKSVVRPAASDLPMIGHFVAAFGAGALISSCLLAGDGAARAWFRTTLFGLIGGAVFGVIAEMQSGAPVDAIDICFYALSATVVFPLVRWLALNGSADHRPSNP